MLNRELVASDKFLALSWPARALYCLVYSFADRDGRLPADRRRLWAFTRCAAIVDLGPFADHIAEMVFVGLHVERKTNDGREFLEIAKFRENQKGMRYQDEPVGEWAMTKEERGAPRAHSRPENGRPTARPLVAEGEGEGEGEVEGEVETEGEWEGERAVTRTIADVVMLTNGEPVNWSGRIWAAWNLAFESRGLIAPTAPKDQETVRIAAETATCARWKTLEQLADEFWRTHVGLEGLKDKSGKRYGSGLTAVLNNLGKQWGEDSEAPTKAERRRSSVAEFSDDPSTGLPYDPRR